MIKRLFSLLLACLFVLLPFASCAKKETPETRVVDYRGLREWNGKVAGYESFEFIESVATGFTANTQKTNVKGTAIRINLTDKETGETECVCRDPLCAHDIASGCPAATRYPVIDYYLVGDVLFCLCFGSRWNGDRLARGESQTGSLHSELRFYNLASGDSGIVFETDANRNQYALVGERYVFYVIPDVEDGRVVYKLSRYDCKKESYLVCAVFDEEYTLRFMTDARVYISRPGAGGVTDPDELDIKSFDYDGKNERDESPVLYGCLVSRGTTLVCEKYAPFPGGLSLLETPYYYFYDLATREYREFPADEPANTIGYRETDGRYYYLTSENSGIFWNANPYLRAAQLEMDYYDFVKSDDYSRMLEERDEYLFNRKTYLRSCDANGGDVRTHFEFPEGTFFCDAIGFTYEGTYFPDSRTGYVSPDGLWFYASTVTQGTNGRDTEATVRINLETGEIEQVGTFDPGLPIS